MKRIRWLIKVLFDRCVIYKIYGDAAFGYTDTECATFGGGGLDDVNDGVESDGTEPVANQNRPV